LRDGIINALILLLMIKYPKTKIKNVAESIHGIKVEDYYRWLEN